MDGDDEGTGSVRESDNSGTSEAESVDREAGEERAEEDDEPNGSDNSPGENKNPPTPSDVSGTASLHAAPSVVLDEEGADALENVAATYDATRGSLEETESLQTTPFDERKSGTEAQSREELGNSEDHDDDLRVSRVHPHLE